jgi:hypothetical protein
VLNPNIREGDCSKNQIDLINHRGRNSPVYELATGVTSTDNILMYINHTFVISVDTAMYESCIVKN